MERRNNRRRIILCIGLILSNIPAIFMSYAQGADWPQWRGTLRNGRSPEVGLLKKWPEGGPKILWSKEGLGDGYSSVSISAGTIYTSGAIDGQGTVAAYDLNGKEKWKTPYGPEWEGKYGGTRSTPTVDGDRVYIISSKGLVVCFDSSSGKIKWQVNILEKFNGKNIGHGLGESPLIVDDKIICTPGGASSPVAALDKMTGKTIWTTPDPNELSAYCSPILVKAGAKQLIVTKLNKSLIAVDAADGRLVWRIPRVAKSNIAAVSPLYHDGSIFFTNGYGKGGMLLDITTSDKGYTTRWTENKLDCYYHGVVHADGFLYGSSHKGQILVCLDMATGKVVCTEDSVDIGSIIYADGMLYYYQQKTGIVSLIKHDANKLTVVSSFEVSKGTRQHWAHPVISDGRLYIRHGDSLIVYDIKEKPLIAKR